MCQALAFLRKADEDEQRFFEDYRVKGGANLQVKSRLDNELWMRNLFHPDENLYIGKIFEMLAAAALAAKMQAAPEDQAAARAGQAVPARIRRPPP